MEITNLSVCGEPTRAKPRLGSQRRGLKKKHDVQKGDSRQVGERVNGVKQNIAQHDSRCAKTKLSCRMLSQSAFKCHGLNSARSMKSRFFYFFG